MIELIDGLLARPARSFDDVFFERLDRQLAVIAGDDDAERMDVDLRAQRFVGAKPEIRLIDYMRLVWPVVEPGRELSIGWHHEVVCEHLEAVSFGQITKLIINIPFRHSKSTMACVMWPTWEWTWIPYIQSLHFTYSQNFTKRDALKSRRIINSSIYKRRWGHVFQLTSDQNEKLKYENDQMGYRISSSFRGSGTGQGGDRVVIDDPIKTSDVHSETKREGVNSTFDEEIVSRRNHPHKSAFVIIAQRTHGQDLPGHLLAKDLGWEHLALPARHEPRIQVEGSFVPPALRNWSNTSLDVRDPRTTRDEPLWPDVYDDAALAELEQELGPWAASAQLQQRPTPIEGGVFKRRWWRFWVPASMADDLPYADVRMPGGELHRTRTVKLPAYGDLDLQSWDLTFDSASSMVVGYAARVLGASVYLLDEERGAWEFTEQIEAVRRLSLAYPTCHLKLVEKAANAKAMNSSTRNTISGVVLYPPRGDKVGRAVGVSPHVASGNVLLPHPALKPWVTSFIEETAMHPNGDYNDRGDTLAQLLDYVHNTYLPSQSEGTPGTMSRATYGT